MHVGFQPFRTRRLNILCLLAICSLMGCGRIGVSLLSGMDAGGANKTDSGGPDKTDSGGGYSGCDAASCDDEPLAMQCGDPSTVSPQAICGCDRSDQDDSDGDGTPDCIDFCPRKPDRSADGATCACAAADADADGDGVANCMDRCPFDAAKTAPAMCGCGRPETDTDADGVPDCLDACLEDPNKSVAGLCGCDHSDLDTDLDGTPDCQDKCSGAADSTYQSDNACGQGICRTTNTPSMCTKGIETACAPGKQLSAMDSNCDGIDEDCDGKVDENYVTTTHSCGQGVCASSGMVSCVAGKVVDGCTPGAARGTTDATCDAQDDDCDGLVDENVPSTASTCAMGACASSGSIKCVTGQLVDSCQAMMPVSPTDTTCNNIDDNCNGTIDEGYVSTNTNCGLGACARTGKLTCSGGKTVDSCAAPKPSAADTTCNKVDEDCDGRVDESYVTTMSSCGTGVCAATGTKSCSSGAIVDSCKAGAPHSSVDDAAAPGNGLDDDCDGKIDENLPACDTTPRTYEAGAYTLSIPGNCRRVTVRLWGGGGGGGQNQGLSGSGAEGGPGGYATASVLVQTPLQLFVGTGASNNCNTAGSNAGSGSYSGGSGGSDTGANGADGMVSGGGSGASPSTGYRGGNGFYGGGGGGQGNGGLGASGTGGGGGAATVLLANGVIGAVAGGGGGGGGGQSLSVLGTLSAAGGKGGSGCRGNGQAPNANGGGGGGGGVCSGSSTQAGADINPAQSGDIPSGRAKGGASNCGGGGAGYAIVTFSPT